MKNTTLHRCVAIALSLLGALGCKDSFNAGTIKPPSGWDAGWSGRGGNPGTGGSVGSGGGPGMGGAPGTGGAPDTGGLTGRGGTGGILTIPDASPVEDASADMPATEPDSGGATDAPGADSGSICSLPADPGPCKANFPRYLYNPATGSCEPFVYGGCEGNANRFDTLEACMSACAPSPLAVDGAVGTGGTPGSGGTVGTGGTTATGGAFGTPCTTNQDCPSDAICCDGGSPSCDGTRLPAGDRANPGEFVVSADGMTVTDTITGLIWQRDGSGTRAGCSADGSLRCTLVEALAYCASLDLGGLVGWRLPAWKELLTIVDPTTDKNTSSIDQTAFPSTPAEGFWSSSPYLGSSSSDFYVDFSNSTVGYCAAPILRRVRCVRGSRCYSTSRFAVLDDEQVRDTLTGLVWQRHDGKTKAGLATCMNWADAQSCCSSLGSGYRLPTLKELDTLLLATGSSEVPILDKTVFPVTMYPPYYWTSSPYGGPDASLSGYARFGGFPTSASCDTGGQNWYELRICWPVRCVR